MKWLPKKLGHICLEPAGSAGGTSANAPMVVALPALPLARLLVTLLSPAVLCAQPSGGSAAAPGGGDGGAFGRWVDADADGMPAFDYTLDQTSPAGAKIARGYHDAVHQTDWRDPRDNLFEFGNDRLVAVASTFGYAQVRQDEQGPKFLQDVDPPSHQEGGGLVYVIDSESRELLASSYFTGGQPDTVQRRFGIGYMSVSQPAAPRGHGNSGAQPRGSSSEQVCRLSHALGCYNDTDCQSCSTGPVVLPVYQPQLHNKVTQSVCASACHALNFTVAGIDGGNHCFCGNPSDLASAIAKARTRPATECQASPCHADPSQKCGGDGRMLAFSFVWCDFLLIFS